MDENKIIELKENAINGIESLEKIIMLANDEKEIEETEK